MPDNDAASPLLLAAMWGRTEAVKALIIGGCELNVTDKDGRSAVYWAAQEGHMDVLRVRICVCILKSVNKTLGMEIWDSHKVGSNSNR